MSMKEQHSQLQHRLGTTEEELHKITNELSERLTEVSLHLFHRLEALNTGLYSKEKV